MALLQMQRSVAMVRADVMHMYIFACLLDGTNPFPGRQTPHYWTLKLPYLVILYLKK